MLRGEYPEACADYTALHAEDARDFPAAYNLGECLRRDRLVVRDASSPSGWSFRSSYRKAVDAYQKAFARWPGTHQGLSGDSFQRVRSLMFVNGHTIRAGTDERGASFVAFAGWRADTLAFVPYEQHLVATGAVPRQGLGIALASQRARFHEIARAWQKAYPHTSEANEALAVALDLLNDPGALTVLRRARTLADGPERRLDLAIAEIWLRLKRAIPADDAELRTVLAMADSLLRVEPTSAAGARRLASIAALAGRPALAASLMIRGAEPMAWPVSVPLAVVRPADALLAYAALGGPLDSMRAYEQRVLHSLRNAIPPEDQPAARAALLHRPAILMFPVYTSALLADRRESATNARLAMRHALASGDTQTVRAQLGRVSARWSALRPVDRQLEAVLGHAQILAAVGDDASALRWLADTLDALSWTQPGHFDDVAVAGSLLRSIALYAELLDRNDHHESAAVWARAVIALWQLAEPDQAPEVARMRTIAAPRGDPRT
jgi:hypothetical protein